MDEKETATGRPVGSGSRRGTDGRSSMRARVWAVAYRYADPETYGIPALPDWRVISDDGGLALAEDGESDPFIRAERPIRVRR
ncbi:hypothetical protein [Halalkalicoccus jeotgali]|nr:hypothetical protein [Halalkalicoccus jeotgali]